MRNPLRRVSALILGAAVAVSLAACSSDDAGESDGGSASSDGGTYPVTVENSNGSVTLDEHPSRIVTLSESAFENVVALGEEPVLSMVTADFDKTAVYDDWREEPYIERGVSVRDGKTFFEKIASADPDLIIAPGWASFTDDDVSEKLNDIAPTYIYAAGGEDAGEQWKYALEDTADLLGKSGDDDVLIGKFNDSINDAENSMSLGEPPSSSQVRWRTAPWRSSTVRMISWNRSVWFPLKRRRTRTPMIWRAEAMRRRTIQKLTVTSYS